MIDLHSHILPAVDDGAKDLDNAFEMALKYLEGGCKTVAVTPHFRPQMYDNIEENIKERIDIFKSDLQKNDIDLEILPGAEYFYDSELLEKLDDPSQIITLGGSGKYVLVEFNPISKPLNLKDFIFKLRLKGITPIMAHPERYGWIRKDFEFAEEIRDHGMLMQGTMRNMSKFFARTTRKTIAKMLDAHLLDFFSTDSHTSRNVEECLSVAKDQLVDLIGEKRVETMLYEIPQAIIKGESI